MSHVLVVVVRNTNIVTEGELVMTLNRSCLIMKIVSFLEISVDLSDSVKKARNET